MSKEVENEFEVPEVVAPAKKNKTLVLRNLSNKDVKPEDYFYAENNGKGKIPVSFNDMCGLPVMREDLVEIFNEVFNPKDDILFYKSNNKEVYIIIIPLRYSTTVGRTHDSINGDFQKHAISFIGEGSVNLDTLRAKLKRIVPFVDFNKR